MLLNRFGKELLFFDGGMGTQLQKKGLSPGELPETMNITCPDIVKSVHMDYLNAGCDIITTNTFGANSLKFDNVEEIISSGVRLVKEAIRESGKKAYTALDVGPTGKLLKPCGTLSFDEAYNLFREQVTSGEKAGADLILIETMGDLYEIKSAVLAAKENTGLPVFVSMIFDKKGKLLTGGDVRTAVVMLEGLGVDGIGLNCGFGPDIMQKYVDEAVRCSSTPVFAQPNAGLPMSVNGKTVYNVSPEEFARKQLDILKKGACALGGCCGTTPEHIKAMVDLCKNEEIIPVTPKNITAVSSYGKTVEFSEKPVIIGERINPTGKKMLKEALRHKDIEYICNEGANQSDCGADILDVNVGLPEINEAEMMVNSVNALQSILDLPLQIDTSDAGVMEKALRIYNGKAMINSVNGKKESMDSIFPLVRKYGGVVVCLTLDENGIPNSSEGRIKIAEKIIRTAESYGISKNDLIFDPLCMSISTDKNNAGITLECVEKLTAKGVKTVLGVSNISFGLPNRDLINSTFFALALQKGLSAGIINPKSEMMMNTLLSFNALSGLDDNFENYISKTTDAHTGAVTEKNDLKTAVIKGLKEQAKKETEKELLTRKPLEIIDEILIPALDFVGKGFEENKIFLPGLLMSAETAGVCFDVLKNEMKKHGDCGAEKGKIILATVEGDIHDIGKNIVKVLLENYGYDVIDLGKDVRPEAVVDAATKHNVNFVGLSALMTTTVPAMEKTVKLLREQNPEIVIVAGGAVLTEEYVNMIGADYYGKDAMTTVRIAEKYFAK